MMGDPGLSRPCEPPSYSAQPVPCELPPPVPPVTFEFKHVRARDRRARALEPRTRRAKYPLPQPCHDGERRCLQPDSGTTTRPYGANVNQLVRGMDRQSLDAYAFAGQDAADWRPSAPSHYDRMQELVREQGEIMDVDPDEVEAEEVPLPPMPLSFEMMRMRRKCTRRGRPVAHWHSSEDANAQLEKPPPTSRNTQKSMTEPMDADRHSPDEAGPEEVEQKELSTGRNFKSMPMRREYIRRSRPLCSRDASPQRGFSQSHTRHAHNTTMKSQPAYWRNQSPAVLDSMDEATYLDLEPDEGYCEGADDMTWLGEAGMLMDGVPSNARLRFRTSAETAMQCSVVVQKNARMRRRRQRKVETRFRASSIVTDASVDTSRSSLLEPPEVPDTGWVLAEPVTERIPPDASARDGTTAATTTGHDEH